MIDARFKIIVFFLFLSNVAPYYISDAPCIQPSLTTFPSIERIQDTVLFVGCYNSTIQLQDPWIYIFNLTTNIWTTHPFPQVNYNPTFASSNDVVFFVGGNRSNIFLNSILIYNLTTDSWSDLTLSLARGAVDVIATDQILVCAGGVVDILGTPTTLVEIYNFTSDTWEYYNLTSPNILSSFAVLDSIYFVEDLGDFYLVEIYETTSNSWDYFQLEINITLSAPIVVNDTIILFPALSPPLVIVQAYDINSKNITEFTLTLSNSHDRMLIATAGQHAILSFSNTPHDANTFLYDASTNSLSAISPFTIVSEGGDSILLRSNTSKPYLFMSHNETFISSDFPLLNSNIYAIDQFIFLYTLHGGCIVQMYNPIINKMYSSLILPDPYFTAVPLQSGFVIVSNNQSYAFKQCFSNETCDDGIFCNGLEYCGNDSFCASGPLPCPDSTMCTQCNEQDNTCFTEIGTPCPGNNFCDGVSFCDGFGQCVGSGNPCLNYSLCNRHCNREFGVCVVNDAGTVCGDCLVCDGEGTCKDAPYKCSSDIQPWEIGLIVGVVGLFIIFASILFFVKRRKNSDYEMIPDREIDTVTFYLIEDVVILEKIASGEFGDVYRGIMDKNVEVALKSLKASDFNSKEFQREVKMLSALNHPNIVRLYGVHEASKTERYMVFEYMAKGSLNRVLREHKDTIKLQTLLKMASQITGGMRYLESNFIVHRDLALRNIFATIDQKGDYIVKIGDFGMSRTVDKGYYQTADKTIPVRWSAPEFIHFGTSSSKSDVFSFGVCLWEIVTYGETPYAGWKNTTVIEKVTAGARLPQPPGCPDDVYRIMQMCWQFEPEKRPTFDELHTKISSLASSYPSVEEEKRVETDYGVYN